MAIHPKAKSPAPVSQVTLTSQQAIEITAWSERAIESVSVTSSPIPYRSSAPLTIPLDDYDTQQVNNSPLRLKGVKIANGAAAEASAATAINNPITYRRREPIRRDSLKRRESLLKGKEGSRRRQRWENDRLLSNPWAQPPSASDWQVQPTCPRHDTVPYYLAPLWDSHYAAMEQARRGSKRNRGGSNNSNVKDGHGGDGSEAGNEKLHQIPKELRTKLKHARAARGLLQELEEEIRLFVQESLVKQTSHPEKGDTKIPHGEEGHKDLTEDDLELESEDEIVSVGRKNRGAPHEQIPPNSKDDFDALMQNYNEKKVFESAAEDRAAGFGRWLVHSLASYYGLRTWSVTVGNPPRREAYVGLDPMPDGQSKALKGNVKSAHPAKTMPDTLLPRPLWVSV